MKRAIGWLGWTEEQALKSTIEAIVLGWEGKCEMLNAVFGNGEPTPPAEPEYQQMTPALFRAVFAGKRK